MITFHIKFMRYTIHLRAILQSYVQS